MKTKSTFKLSLFLLLFSGEIAMSQSLVTGPSTSITPYMWPAVPGASVISILSSGESVNGYSLCAPGDGMGYLDNGGTTFTVYHNVEISYPSGSIRAHGQPGAFIQEWVIQKSNFQVLSGSDLIQQVNLWTGSTYTTYNANNTSTIAAFSRFCAGDLPAASAFYNNNTGKGSLIRFFMNGEEVGSEGRAFAHGLTGSEDGKSYELPFLGKMSFENAVASPFAQDKTIIAELDDSSPYGQVYFYIGNKGLSGTEIEKAGLTGGKLYGISINGIFNEQTSSFATNTPFNMIDMGPVHTIPGATLETNSINKGVTNFMRPEDGAWNPNNPNEFYFNCTASMTAPSRLYRLRFYDIKNPELGGTITAVLNGTEGQKMLDNLGVDNHGNILLQEDPGNNNYRAKIYNYGISSGLKTTIFDSDSTRFQTGGVNFLTIDEENSGIFDIQGIKGAGWFLSFMQAHYPLPNPMTEGGQLMALFNPFTSAANSEINITGNNQNIVDGATIPNNLNNTDFGKTNIGDPLTLVFNIQNTSTGTLIISNYYISGVNAGDFVMTGPSFPFNISPNSSKTVAVTFNPAFTGIRNAELHVINSDFDEGDYDFKILGEGVTPEIEISGNSVIINTGSTATSTLNGTHFGSVYLNQSLSKTFLIKNTGSGTLNINSISISGNQSSEFINVSNNLPVNLSPNATFSVQINATPLLLGSRKANVSIQSNDADETISTFNIEVNGMLDVGINETMNYNEFNLFPNPANNNVNIIFNKAEFEKHIVIINSLGQKVFEEQIEENIIEKDLNINNLNSGMYLVKIMQGSSYSCKYLIISK